MFALVANKSCFEISQDGGVWQAYMDYQVHDRAAFSQLGVDAHQGSFDSYYPLINDFTLPGAIYRLAGAATAPSPVATYAIYTAMLFALMLLLGRSFATGPSTALLGAFIAAFFFPPLVVHQGAQTFRFMQLNPHWIQLIVLSALAIIAIWALDGKWSLSRVLLIVVPSAVVTVEVLSLGAMVIFTPAVVLYSAAALLFSRSRAEFIQRLAAGILTVVVVVATGQAGYLYGVEAYSAYEVFGQEFDRDYPYLVNMSILFSFPFGTILIVLGLGGALLMLRDDNRRLRQLAAAHLIATVLFLVACVIFYATTYRPGYRASAPMYFETTYMPFAALFCAIAIVRLATRLMRRVTPSGALFGFGPAEASLTLLVVAVAAWNVAAAELTPDRCASYQRYANIKPTPITELLQTSVGLGPGTIFHGNVATIDWVSEDQAAVDYSLMDSRNESLRNEKGNDHRLFGLWHYGIPTIHQPLTFITAPYYLMVTEFLARPRDVQTRSALVLTRADSKMLQLWGVRYLITDHQSSVGRELVSLPTASQFSLRLIELDAPNLGNYSPTQVQRVASFHDGIALMHASDFDGTKTVITDVTDNMVNGGLLPATNAQLTFETYGFRVTAQSVGKSVLVLPAQFSRCWSLRDGGTPRLFRANLMQLGLEFSGKLDAQVVFRHGPLFASECRLRDVQDMKRLQISAGRVTPRIVAEQSRP